MNRAIRRRPLSKAELLPLPADKLRGLSLEHHLALAVARTGQGEPGQLGCLMRVLYVAFLLRDLTPDQGDNALFRRSEAALNRCLARATDGKPWALPPEESPPVEWLVALHDRQLATVPVHRYVATCDRIARGFLSDPDWTPIPPVD